MKTKFVLTLVPFFGVLGAVAAQYDLEYENADGEFVQVEKADDSLMTAVGNVKNKGTIRLLDDVTVGSASLLGSRNYVLDGEGHTISIGARLTFVASGNTTVVTLTNVTLTATTSLSAQLFQTSYRGTIVLDNVTLKNYTNSSQIFILQSGTVRIVNGSRIENVSGDLLFHYAQTNGDATHCGDTGFTNLVEIVDSTLVDIKTENSKKPVVPLYQARWYPAVFRMANSTLAGCSLEHGIKMNDQDGTSRTDDGGYYLPELYLESGTAITNNAFSVAAVGIAPKNNRCTVAFTGDLVIHGNGKDVVFENRVDTLTIHAGVTGEIRVSSPGAEGDPFAIADAGAKLSAFKVTGDDSLRAVFQEGKAVWAKATAGLMLIVR